MAWPSSSARTKTWGTEILTTSDQHAQLDLLHSYFNDSLNATTGHDHSGGTAEGPKINVATGITVTSQAQGDVLYASSSSAFARLGAGTAGMFLKTLGASANPAWAYAPIFKIGNTSLDLSASTGTFNSGAIGFTPRFLVVLGNQTGNARASIGFGDGTNYHCIYEADAGNAFYTSSSGVAVAGSGSDQQVIAINTLADPVVFSNTKLGTPTGTFSIGYLAIQ